MGIRDVAAAAGVSVSTASRALTGKGRISPETREKVLAAAQSMGYRPNELARQLKAGTSTTIGAVVPDINNPFFPELVKGVQDVADSWECVLLLAQTGDDVNRTIKAIGEMRARRVAGVVIIDDRLSSEQLIDAVGDLPFVAVDRHLEQGTSVTSDHRGGAFLATTHLLELGHRTIAHITGPSQVRVSQQRLAGYRDALQGKGLDVDPSLVVEADFGERAAHGATVEVLQRHPEVTAVFAASDLAAIGVMRAAETLGRRVPEDVSVVGFDDIHLASYLRPGLTTVRQQIGLLGQTAAQALLEGERDEESVVLPVELVVRGTTAALRAGGAG